MALNINEVRLLGRVGRDPEVRYLPNGDAVASLSLATSERWKDKSGEWQERTEWHRISAFGKLAELVSGHIEKGRELYVTGKLQTRKWQDKEGQDRYTTEIVASRIQFGAKPKDGGNDRATHDVPLSGFDEDDIPF